MVNSGELKRKQNNNRVIIHFGRLYKKATIECRIRLRIDQSPKKSKKVSNFKNPISLNIRKQSTYVISVWTKKNYIRHRTMRDCMSNTTISKYVLNFFIFGPPGMCALYNYEL